MGKIERHTKEEGFKEESRETPRDGQAGSSSSKQQPKKKKKQIGSARRRTKTGCLSKFLSSIDLAKSYLNVISIVTQFSIILKTRRRLQSLSFACVCLITSH